MAAPEDANFVITRTYEAPRALVWQAWTEGERLQRWFGPKGVTLRHCTMDLRPGGMMHYGMAFPDGNLLWGRWIIREIAAPERLVFVVSFSDEKGGITRHPWSAEWPLETLSTMTLTEQAGTEQAGRTIVSVTWTPLDATEAERATFAAGHESMQQGWGGTLDKLADHLKGA